MNWEYHKLGTKHIFEGLHVYIHALTPVLDMTVDRSAWLRLLGDIGGGGVCNYTPLSSLKVL